MVIITPISDKKKSTVPEPDTVLFGGDYRDRTGDLLHAMQALSQLSYTPKPLWLSPKKNPCISKTCKGF